MISKLSKLGINIDWQRVQEIADGGAIGRPHLAQAMLENGYITSLKEAFIKYISRGGSAYVEREKMTAVEAVDLILRAGGLPVLAHPFTVGNPETLVAKLKNIGLVGIEAYYNGYTEDSIKQLLCLARKYELVSTGGSDYHGLDDSIETMIGGTETPIESAERLIALAK
jgi:predicted metal-dependent phosphoesterase TrpH